MENTDKNTPIPQSLKTDVSDSVVFDEENEPYCRDCGESENLKYNDQYANGEYWTCKECDYSFFFTRVKHYH